MITRPVLLCNLSSYYLFSFGLRFADSHNLPFSQIFKLHGQQQGSLPDDVYLGASYSYVTMFRDPMDRALSSYHWWRVLVKEFGRYNFQTSSLCQTFYVPNNATFDEWLEHYKDNWQVTPHHHFPKFKFFGIVLLFFMYTLIYNSSADFDVKRKSLLSFEIHRMTRSYAGRGIMYSNKPVTESEFLLAISRLHYYSAILIMERFDDNMEILRYQFGWKDVDASGHREGSKRNSNAYDELNGHPALIEKLERLHVWDKLLYEYGVVSLG